MKIKTLNINAHFLLRTGMYISPVSKETICAFITGYEIGKPDKFSDKISKRLSSEYDIENLALGWPGQINEYAFREDINWTSAFKRIAFEVIFEDLNDTEREDFYSVFKDRVKGTIDRIEINSIDERSITEWIGLVHPEAQWFKPMWGKAQYEIIVQINDEILKIYSSPNKSYSLTENLIKLKAKFAEYAA